MKLSDLCLNTIYNNIEIYKFSKLKLNDLEYLIEKFCLNDLMTV